MRKFQKSCKTPSTAVLLLKQKGHECVRAYTVGVCVDRCPCRNASGNYPQHTCWWECQWLHTNTNTVTHIQTLIVLHTQTHTNSCTHTHAYTYLVSQPLSVLKSDFEIASTLVSAMLTNFLFINSFLEPSVKITFKERCFHTFLQICIYFFKAELWFFVMSHIWSDWDTRDRILHSNLLDLRYCVCIELNSVCACVCVCQSLFIELQTQSGRWLLTGFSVTLLSFLLCRKFPLFTTCQLSASFLIELVPPSPLMHSHSHFQSHLTLWMGDSFNTLTLSAPTDRSSNWKHAQNETFSHFHS